ncbi:MAG: hypothetical protein QOD99_220 [Chthoniobacter sp.]|jgi:two-component system sensor histidine kinase QseC|nr:hypothetical protein [Chthoniobacter sp.]
MKSLRQQLTITLLIGFGLLLAAGIGAIYFGTRGMLFREFDATLLTKARALASMTESDGGVVELQLVDELMPEFGRRQREAFFELSLANGSVAARSLSLAGAGLSHGTIRAAKTPQFWDQPLPNGNAGRAVSFIFNPAGEEGEHTASAHSPVTLLVALDRTHLDAHLRVFAISAVAASVLMMIGASLVAAISTRRAFASLAELGQKVAAIDETSLGSRLLCDPFPTELMPICRRLNELLARLDGAFIRERRFSDDVAHELRTPIAELRALADLSLDSELAQEQVVNGFQDALAISRQMEDIVNGLLAIARFEGGRHAIRFEPIALLPFLLDLWRPHAQRAKDKSLKVVLQVSPDIVALSDPASLRVIVPNFLSNAVEYAPVGSEVSISALRIGSTVHLTVTNPAGVLTKEDLSHLFDRFWRKDTARASSSHAGLGLSIAQAAAQPLGVDLTANITEGGLFVISLHLPIVSPESPPGP